MYTVPAILYVAMLRAFNAPEVHELMTVTVNIVLTLVGGLCESSSCDWQIETTAYVPVPSYKIATCL